MSRSGRDIVGRVVDDLADASIVLLVLAEAQLDGEDLRMSRLLVDARDVLLVELEALLAA